MYTIHLELCNAQGYNEFMVAHGSRVSKYSWTALQHAVRERLAEMSHPQATYICCDGACQGNGVKDNAAGGWGFVMARKDDSATPAGDLMLRIGRGSDLPTTNNRMELMAAISALETLPKGDAPILLETDSTYVIDGCTKWREGWQRRGMRKSGGDAVLNPELWQRLWKLIDERKVEFRWVRGHNGFAPNEVADMLSVQGADKARETSQPAWSA